MKTCRYCHAPLSIPLVDLGTQPLANSYLSQADAPENSFPLKVSVCERCFLAQVEDDVPADKIFTDDYAYFSSVSKSWVDHARRYASQMIQRFGLDSTSRVVEVASNDGYLLQHFVQAGIPSLGVDPAADCAASARAKGVETEVGFFDADTAARLRDDGFAADLMAANNVLAHVPDIRTFVEGFRILLKDDGVATFEFPHLLNLINHVQFDTIYHEHYSYLSLLVVEHALSACGLRVFDVEQLATHGGSLRLFVCRAESDRHPEMPPLESVRQMEREAGLDSSRGYKDFASRCSAVREDLNGFLKTVKSEGKTVAAFGAAAKGNTLLNYSGVVDGDVVFVSDSNPAKQGKFLPGSRIPILPPSAIDEHKPDYVLILPWNLRDEISADLARVREWGGRFVVAVPKIEIF